MKPRIIHQVWIGAHQRPDRLLVTRSRRWRPNWHHLRDIGEQLPE